MIEIFAQIAAAVKVSPLLLLSLCWQESHHRNVINPHDSGSKSYGVCQVKMDTAKTIIPTVTEKELMNPEINIYVAAKYLKRHLNTYEGDEQKALSRYNGGYKGGKITNRRYVKKILGYMATQPWEVKSNDENDVSKPDSTSR